MNEKFRSQDVNVHVVSKSVHCSIAYIADLHVHLLHNKILVNSDVDTDPRRPCCAGKQGSGGLQTYGMLEFFCVYCRLNLVLSTEGGIETDVGRIFYTN